MKNIVVFLMVLLFAVSISAASTWQKRLSNTPECIAEGGSYTFVDNIDVSSADWTIPDSVIILAVCVSDSGNIRVDVKDATTKDLYMPIEFCYPINLKKVYKIGTNEALRIGFITVFGFVKK